MADTAAGGAGSGRHRSDKPTEAQSVGARLSSTGDTWSQFLRSLEVVEHIALTSRGPGGHFKVLRAEGGGASTVTTTSSLLLKRAGLEKTSPAVRLLADVTNGHLAEHGDGGLLLLGLASRLTRTCRSLDVPRMTVLNTLPRCAAWAAEYLESDDCPCAGRVRWNSLRSISAAATGVLAAKGVCRLDETDTQCIVTLLLQAFLACVHDGGDPSPLIRFVSLPGFRPTDSWVVTAGALLDLPLPEDGRHSIESAAVALFDVSLRAPEAEVNVVSTTGTGGAGEGGDSTKASESADVVWGTGAVEVAQLERLGRQLVRHNVGLVACQRLIHPWLKRFLLSRGIIPLERLSIRHIGAVRCITGAEVNSAWDCTLKLSSLGWCCRLRPFLVGARQYVEITGPRADADASSAAARAAAVGVPKEVSPCMDRLRPTATVVLCAADEAAAEELDAAARATVKVLSGLLRNPRALAGGGCAELHAAAAVRARCAREWSAVSEAHRSDPVEGAHRRAVVDAFAAALEECAWALVEPHGVRCKSLAREALEEASVKNAATLTDRRGADARVADAARSVFGWVADTYDVAAVLSFAAPIGSASVDERDITDAVVLDSLASKVSAIRSATDVATALLKVGPTVVDAR